MRPGTLLCGGRYRIVRYLSSGGFGYTYEAVHVQLGKRIAIKEFFPEDHCNRDPDTSHVSVGVDSKRQLVVKLMGKFIDEAKVVANYKHPGIVQVSDVFEENGTAYYVMDYIEGGSLNDRIKATSRMSEADAVRYIRQVCDALKYVHSLNRLHLDLKPANMMIDDKDRAVLIDFGASKQYDEESGENRSESRGHTPGYAPPEQMDGNIKKFSEATDIYALGMTLYKLLTGANLLTSNERVSGEELEPLPAGVSAGTRAAIEAAIRLNKKSRPQSVSEFLALLDGGKPKQRPKPKPEPVKPEDTEVTEVKPTKPPMPSPQPGSKPSDSHRNTLLAILVGALVAVVIGVWGYLATRQSGGGNPGNDTIVSDTIAVVEQPETEVKSTASSGTINGHEYVDLGLSVKWATCNVGASSPSGYGNYYAWGETSTKSTYTEENSKTYGNSSYNYDIGGNSSTDAARANWGGTWRLPTKAEFQELLDKCTWTWTTQGDHKGYRVTGPNGNSIFLPAAGYRGESLGNVGSDGYYWTSSPNGSYSNYAYNLVFYSGYHGVSSNYRIWGHTVRPVSE